MVRENAFIIIFTVYYNRPDMRRRATIGSGIAIQRRCGERNNDLFVSINRRKKLVRSSFIRIL